MKKCLILAASFLLSSCAVGPSPKFPEDLKDYFVTMVNGQEIPKDFQSHIINVDEIPMDKFGIFFTFNQASCLHFELIEKHPVKIKYIEEVPLKSCHLVGGFIPQDTQHLFNWIDDMWDWAETRKKCFK